MKVYNQIINIMYIVNERKCTHLCIANERKCTIKLLCTLPMNASVQLCTRAGEGKEMLIDPPRRTCRY